MGAIRLGMALPAICRPLWGDPAGLCSRRFIAAAYNSSDVFNAVRYVAIDAVRFGSFNRTRSRDINTACRGGIKAICCDAFDVPQCGAIHVIRCCSTIDTPHGGATDTSRAIDSNEAVARKQLRQQPRGGATVNRVGRAGQVGALKVSPTPYGNRPAPRPFCD